MPFQNLSLSLAIVVASLLTHQMFAVHCASLAAVSTATVPTAAEANVSASESSLGDLMDKSKLTFLDNCTQDAVTKNVCELYRNLTMVLRQEKGDPVTAADVKQALNEQEDGDRFCDNLIPLLQAMKQKHPNRFESKRLEIRRFCENFCVPFETETMLYHVNPICKALLWGFKKVLQPVVDGERPAEDILIPPMIPVDGEQVESNAVQSQVVAAASNSSAPEAENKASLPKDVETEGEKQPMDTAVVRPNEAVGPSTLQSTMSSAQKNPEVADDSLDPKEERNQNNLKDINNNGSFDNLPEDGDTDDDMAYAAEDAQETSENTQSKMEQEPFGGKKADSGDAFTDHKVDSAVHVERVEQEDPFFDQDDSNFFSYFLFMMFVCILCYVAYHNKSKLLALVLEGRRTNSGRGGFNKGRKHTAAYRKLDSNLEEAITSNASASSRSTNQIIY